jgi:predicted negative regulator of RcsB-dependent stress response
LALEVPFKGLRAIHFFYRGEALKALGREQEARSAWAAAVENGGAGPWATRAKARLEGAG